MTTGRESCIFHNRENVYSREQRARRTCLHVHLATDVTVVSDRAQCEGSVSEPVIPNKKREVEKNETL